MTMIKPKKDSFLVKMMLGQQDVHIFKGGGENVYPFLAPYKKSNSICMLHLKVKNKTIKLLVKKISKYIYAPRTGKDFLNMSEKKKKKKSTKQKRKET